jgi:hypothetical protein
MSIFKMAEYFWEFEKSENRVVTIMLLFSFFQKINCDQQKKKVKIKTIITIFSISKIWKLWKTKMS